MKKQWAVVLPLLVAACGPKDANGDGIADGIQTPNSVSVVAPATPKGTVSGQVLDSRMNPLSGAAVRVLIGSETAESKFSVSTDDTGSFLVKEVPAGSTVLVIIGKEGYATLRADALVPSSAGTIPINNGNVSLGMVVLAEARTSLSFSLLTAQGAPAAGAKAYLEATPTGFISSSNISAAASTVVATPAVADGAGLVTFTNLPSPTELIRLGSLSQSTLATASYNLWVEPVDVNGDGTLDAGGYASPIDAKTLLKGGQHFITLEAPQSDTATSAFAIVSTNVPSLRYALSGSAEDKKTRRNLLRSGEPIRLGFSQPVARESLIAFLTSESGQTPIELAVAASGQGDLYTLTPGAGTINEGQEYNLVVRATSAYSSAVQTWRGFFIGGDVKAPKALALASVTFKDSPSGTSGVLDAGECVILTFNQVVTTTVASLSASLEATGKTPYLAKNLLPAPYPSAGCFADEPVKVPIDTASFPATTRFYFTYGTPAEGQPQINPALGAKVKVDFSAFQKLDFTAYYETAWGAPVPSSTVLEQPLTVPPR